MKTSSKILTPSKMKTTSKFRTSSKMKKTHIPALGGRSTCSLSATPQSLQFHLWSMKYMDNGLRHDEDIFKTFNDKKISNCEESQGSYGSIRELFWRLRTFPILILRDSIKSSQCQVIVYGYFLCMNASLCFILWPWWQHAGCKDTPLSCPWFAFTWNLDTNKGMSFSSAKTM